MSEEIIKEIIEKAIKDEKFRALLFENPQKALEGYKLTDEDRQVLENLNEDNFDDFAGGLGDRSTKGSWVVGA